MLKVRFFWISLACILLVRHVDCCAQTTTTDNLHIIKLKKTRHDKDSIEPKSFLRKHYALYKETAPQNITAALMMDARSLDTVHVGQDFSAIVGPFDPDFAAYLHRLDVIDYVEPNQVYKVAHYRENVKRTTQQQPAASWGLARIQQRQRGDLSIRALDDSLAGEGIHVYVFDTGINVNHPDIQGRAYLEANFIDYEGHEDISGHGTHVAGTIGGTTFGVANRVQLHSIKVLDRNGDGTTVSLIKAISYVSQNAVSGKSIINLSLSGPPSQSIDDALSSAAIDHNIPVFVAAGNSADDACRYTPAANPNVFAVGASNKEDKIASFSAFGPCVRMYAPGTGITSSWVNNASHTMDGTSMANPHITGIAALIMAERNFTTVSELYTTLMTMATKDVLQMPVAAQGFQNYNLLAYASMDG